MSDNTAPDIIRVMQYAPADQPLPAGFVTVDDAAKYLGVARETIRRVIASERLKAERQEHTPGRQGWRWMIPTETLMEFGNSRKT